MTDHRWSPQALIPTCKNTDLWISMRSGEKISMWLISYSLMWLTEMARTIDQSLPVQEKKKKKARLVPRFWSADLSIIRMCSWWEFTAFTVIPIRAGSPREVSLNIFNSSETNVVTVHAESHASYFNGGFVVNNVDMQRLPPSDT